MSGVAATIYMHTHTAAVTSMSHFLCFYEIILIYRNIFVQEVIKMIQVDYVI